MQNNRQQEMPQLTSTRKTLVILLPSGLNVESLNLLARNKEGLLSGEFAEYRLYNYIRISPTMSGLLAWMPIVFIIR